MATFFCSHLAVTARGLSWSGASTWARKAFIVETDNVMSPMQDKLLALQREIKQLESDGNVPIATVKRLEHHTILQRLYNKAGLEAKDANLGLAQCYLHQSAPVVALQFLMNTTLVLLGQTSSAIEQMPLMSAGENVKLLSVINTEVTREERVQQLPPGTSFYFPARSIRLDQVKLLHLLAQTFEQLQKLHHADFYYQHSLDLLTRVYGEYHVDVLQVLTGAARVCTMLRQWPRAIEISLRHCSVLRHMMESAKGRDKKLFAQLQHQVVLVCINCAKYYQHDGQFTAAIRMLNSDVRPYLEQQQQQQQLSTLITDVQLPDVYLTLTQLYMSCGRYKDARVVLSKLDEQRDDVTCIRLLQSVLECLTAASAAGTVAAATGHARPRSVSPIALPSNTAFPISVIAAPSSVPAAPVQSARGSHAMLGNRQSSRGKENPKSTAGTLQKQRFPLRPVNSQHRKAMVVRSMP